MTENSLSPPPASLQNRSSRISYREDSLTRGGPQSISPYRNPSTVRGRSESRDGRSWSRVPLFKKERSEPSPPVNPIVKPAKKWYQFSKDYRASFFLSRFTGYKPPNAPKLLPPLRFPPFSWLVKIPLQAEMWLLGWIGAFVGIVLIEAVMSEAALFQRYEAPLIIGSFGATAVLLFGMPDSPVSQPRNVVGGQVLSALTAVIIGQLFALRPGKNLPSNDVPNNEFTGYLTWLEAALSMATSLTVMQVSGTLHPPGGATAVLGAVLPSAAALRWRYIFVILVQSLLIFGWAMLILNVGRKRYPMYWWSPEKKFVVPQEAKGEKQAISDQQRGFELERLEEGLEGELRPTMESEERGRSAAIARRR